MPKFGLVKNIQIDQFGYLNAKMVTAFILNMGWKKAGLKDFHDLLVSTILDLHPDESEAVFTIRPMGHFAHQQTFQSFLSFINV